MQILKCIKLILNRVPNDKIIESIIPISIISLVLLIIIFFIRVLFYLLIFILSKIYFRNRKIPKKKQNFKKNTDIVVYKKEEEELYRDLKKEKKKANELNLRGVQRMNNDFEEKNDLIDEREDTKIVGIAKPIGFWTSLILGDQLSQIIGRAQALNSRSHKGFWVSMLEAQARGLGRQHGKQRGM